MLCLPFTDSPFVTVILSFVKKLVWQILLSPLPSPTQAISLQSPSSFSKAIHDQVLLIAIDVDMLIEKQRGHNVAV